MYRWVDQSDLAARTGIVVAAYFSPKPSDQMVYDLLWMTLGDTHHYVPLEQVCVVVDGDARTTRLADEIRAQLLGQHGTSFQLLPLPENRGKFWALREGVRALLQSHPQVDFMVMRDGDGDHAASAVPQLVRAACHLEAVYSHLCLLVIGARPSRHHPMDWFRGELETLLDGLTVDALAYAAAREGRALNLSHCARGVVPDISSGFKVYGREIARQLFLEHEPVLATLSAEDYWHYGPETVAVVEALQRGCVMAETLRLTWDGQPTSSFGEFKHLALYGELLTWVYARLEIPLRVAAQLYDNRAPAMALRTMTEGRALLEALRTYVLEKLVRFRGDEEELPKAPPGLPFL
ncbi:MAG: hypothetical protein JXA74_02825 [Anaerolineae bacterium]|nr:hypothetical protein [Anaerolineae bacterium]